jgi:SAM-dependent methyltransferase
MTPSSPRGRLPGPPSRATVPAGETLFCLTSDLDWASEFCIEDLLGFATELGLHPTIFATHQSGVVSGYRVDGLVDVAIHPNFLPGSSHGADEASVIGHMFDLVPDAETFRSHCFVDSTGIVRQMLERGISYDSNLCLHLQPGLVPLHHGTGILRFPVFWEDDCHWDLTGGDWNVDRWLDRFLTPGLKILNVHPFAFAANITSTEHYRGAKSLITSLSARSAAADVRHSGPGTRTFVTTLVCALLDAGARFYSLKELYSMSTAKEHAAPHEGGGRVTVHSEDEYRRYRTMTEEERQDFVRREYERRDAADPYATSRDYNARELEIVAIRGALGKAGTLLDLGCGNGYTLLVLGEALAGWDLRGIDFSPNLIAGANRLLEERRSGLRSVPRFQEADAVAHLAGTPDASVDYVLTERFIQNLPSEQRQVEVIRDIRRILRPGGLLLMCEGSEDGFEALNDIREKMGLARIPSTSRENVSAIRFDENAIERVATAELGYRLRSKVGFSTFFLVTRVLHPLLVAPESPRFDAPINDLARQLQQHAPMLPGFGSNVLWVLEKPAA